MSKQARANIPAKVSLQEKELELKSLQKELDSGKLDVEKLDRLKQLRDEVRALQLQQAAADFKPSHCNEDAIVNESSTGDNDDNAESFDPDEAIDF